MLPVPQRQGMHRHLKGLLVALLLCAPTVQAATIQLLGAGAGSEEFVAALRAELGGDHQVLTETAAPDIVVALHEGVLVEARALAKPRLLLLPAAGPELRPDETALYWAPSLSDQLHLALHIMPGLRRVGLLVGAQDLARAQALRHAPGHKRIELLVRQAEPAQLVRQVSELAVASDVLLAPVDGQLFSRDNLKPVLLAAYRQNRVFIGPTPAYVRAGALASLYATPLTLAADVAAAVRGQLQHKRWPTPSQVSRFDVITNPQVARALGLRLPDAASLTREIQSQKVTPWP